MTFKAEFSPSAVSCYTGIYLSATTEDALPQALEPILDPVGHARRKYQEFVPDSDSCVMREVVIKVGDEERVLTFDEFEERYCS